MAEINRTAIEQRAHKIWIARGRRDGHAIEDWVQAEVELRAEAARASKPAGTGYGGNLAAPGAPAKGAGGGLPKGGAAPAGGVQPAGGFAAPAGSAPAKNGNRPSKNGPGTKK
jgi:hypothetical protein